MLTATGCSICGYVMAVLVILSSLHHASASTECEKLGFTGLQSCSDCDSMAEYVKDAELIADCKQCCVTDEEDKARYTDAQLEICPYRLNGLPAIQDFLDKHSGRYKNFKVKRIVGSYPKLILSHKETGKRTSVRVDNWKVATFHEFLTNKLEPAKPRAL